MLPELVIFDCDGILVDTERLSAQVLSLMLSEQGLWLSQQEADQRYRGRSLSDCFRLIEQELGQKLPSDFLLSLNQRTYQAFKGALKAVPGVKEAIERIQEFGIPTCVASSGSHEKIRLTLGLTGLLPLFEGRCFSASEVPHGKPAPDLFLFAATQMGKNIRRCVIVEDSLPGMRAGVASGARVLGYLPPLPGSSTQRDAIRQLGVEPFGSMTRLPGLLFFK